MALTMSVILQEDLCVWIYSRLMVRISTPVLARRLTLNKFRLAPQLQVSFVDIRHLFWLNCRMFLYIVYLRFCSKSNWLSPISSHARLNLLGTGMCECLAVLGSSVAYHYSGHMASRRPSKALKGLQRRMDGRLVLVFVRLLACCLTCSSGPSGYR